MSSRWGKSTYGCTTWADNVRTFAYHAWACANGLYPDECEPILDHAEDCFCPNDDPGDVFTDPITDNAPWYNSAYPESAEFLGAMIMHVDGVKDSTWARTVAEALNDGTILQRPRLNGRALAFDIMILSTSCAGQQWGVEWLRRVFEDTVCCTPSPSDQQLAAGCDACVGKTLGLRIFCSEVNDEGCDAGFREYDRIGLVDGIKPIDDDGLKHCCCVMQRYSMTMQAETPFSYECTNGNFCGGALEASEDAYTRCYDWEFDCFTCDDTCSACNRCVRDPLCNCFPVSVEIPEIIVAECFCEPFEKIMQCCCIEPEGSGIGFDLAYILHIQSRGCPDPDPTDAIESLGLRNVKIKFYDNSLDLPCITDDDSYAAWCEAGINPFKTLLIDYVPDFTELIIDGRKERIDLICDDACYNHSSHVTVEQGGSVFPLISQCTGNIMICVEWDAANVATLEACGAGSSLEVETTRRWRS